MKKALVPLFGIALAGWLCGCGASQPAADVPAPEPSAVAPAAEDQAMTLEMGCAMCIYNQEGIDRCTTAAKLGETVYLVDSSVDAHSAGLCKAAKTATVMAHVAGDRLVASSVTFD